MLDDCCFDIARELFIDHGSESAGRRAMPSAAERPESGCVHDRDSLAILLDDDLGSGGYLGQQAAEVARRIGFRDVNDRQRWMILAVASRR
jgi:hypothetical protein